MSYWTERLKKAQERFPFEERMKLFDNFKQMAIKKEKRKQEENRYGKEYI